VAVQTIKSVARRRWRPEDPEARFSWYKPITDPKALRRAVQYVLACPDLFLNSSSDARLLPAILEAAAERIEEPSAAALDQDHANLAIEPLFVRGISDEVFPLSP